jgi:hypothetical protein
MCGGLNLQKVRRNYGLCNNGVSFNIMLKWKKFNELSNFSVKILGTGVCGLFLVVQRREKGWFVDFMAVTLHERRKTSSDSRDQRKP